MKAALLRDFAKPLSFEDVPVPVPADDEVLIRIEACGVCHSDLHIAEGDQPLLRERAKMPLIPGHEVVGRVVGRGVAVTRPAIGARVGVAWRYSACGVCDSCREGRENLCQAGGTTGLTVDGGYAEFMCAKASHALPVPDALTPEQAAPLFCAGVTVYRALRRAEVGPGQRVAVVGVGGLGHLAVQVAVAFGAEVFALDVADDKLALARALGASRTFRAQDPQTAPAIAALGGVHVAVVTSAAKAAYDAALMYLRPGGTLAVVGLPSKPLTFPALALVGLELRIIGSAVGTRDDMRAVLDMAAAGRLRCEVETQPLAQVNDVFARMRNGGINGRVVLTGHA
jgi:propanol-preferring alcohol dehydrogenase